VAIIDGGEVVAAGTPAELSRAGGVEVETAAGVRTFRDATRDDAPRIVRELVAAGEDVYGVRALSSNLEDAYLEAVGRAPAAGAEDASEAPADAADEAAGRGAEEADEAA